MIKVKFDNNTLIMSLTPAEFDAKQQDGDYNGYTFIEEIIPNSVPSSTSIKNLLVGAVQKYMDSVAKEKGYDNILSACTYATSTNPTFAAEGQACVAWRDEVWAYCYQVLADVQAGNRTVPTKEQLISELPIKPW